jgi:hypothetical protein
MQGVTFRALSSLLAAGMIAASTVFPNPGAAQSSREPPRSSCFINNIPCDKALPEFKKASWHHWCDSQWNRPCKGWEAFCLPDNYVACGYRVDRLTNSEASEYRVGGMQNNCVNSFVRAWGSGLPSDRWRGDIRIQVTVVGYNKLVVPRKAKRDLQCAIAGDNAGSEVKNWCVSAGSPRGGPSGGIMMCQKITIRSDGTRQAGTPYVCGACAGYDG